MASESFIKGINMERTFFLIKPDAVRRKLIGKIISKIEEAGFEIKRMRMETMEREKAEKLYIAHKEKSFFQEFMDYLISGPVVGMVLEKENAIKELRELIGATDPKKAKPGTIRYEYGINERENAVHGSASKEEAEKEIKIFFHHPSRGQSRTPREFLNN